MSGKTNEPAEPATPTKRRLSPRLVMVLVVVAMVAAVLLAKSFSPPQGTTSSGGNAQTTPAGESAPPSDAVAAYEAALKAGKPIYVLFHSTTCAPCIEIDGVADTVIPDYADKITFVDAVTDDPSAQELASRFSFQYIPTSFFLKSDGARVDSFTGAMDDAQMRGYLDALVATQ